MHVNLWVPQSHWYILCKVGWQNFEIRGAPLVNGSPQPPLFKLCIDNKILITQQNLLSKSFIIWNVFATDVLEKNKIHNINCQLVTKLQARRGGQLRPISFSGLH